MATLFETRPRAAETAAEEVRIAVVIPCHDEAARVGDVVRDFRSVLPQAEIVVVDNASRDATAVVAGAAGARIVRESRTGKGYALLTGLAAVRDADFVLVVDGDDTYAASAAPALLAAARAGADLVVGTRLEGAAPGAFPAGHTFGNRMFIWIVRLLFGVRTRDLFSGYRVLSRRFLSSTPVLATGFEIEAELTLQAAMRGFTIVEIPIPYRPRSGGGASKLATVRDGSRILLAILTYFRDSRPLACFGVLAGIFAGGATLFGSVVIAEFVDTGLVNRLPLAVLAAALFILGALSLTCGVLLSSINRRAAELAALIAGR
jgi:glycosyltransferase involved in cell wall biosynthesis